MRAYAAGDAFLEAMANAHVARNRGDAPARILAVYLSGDGNALALPAEAPAE